MPWFTRFSRFGDIHMVYSQKAINSCGIAAVMMCVFKVNKLVPGVAAVLQEQEVYKKYGTAAGATYDGSSYTFTSYLESTLNGLQCGKWKASQLAATDVTGRLISTCGSTAGLGPTIVCSPVIVLIEWNDVGAHFVVVDSVRTFMGSTYATVCDPADGQLRVVGIESGTALTYKNTSTIHLDLEGDPDRPYVKPRAGMAAGGWVIHQV